MPQHPLGGGVGKENPQQLLRDLHGREESSLPACRVSLTFRSCYSFSTFFQRFLW